MTSHELDLALKKAKQTAISEKDRLVKSKANFKAAKKQAKRAKLAFRETKERAAAAAKALKKLLAKAEKARKKANEKARTGPKRPHKSVRIKAESLLRAPREFEHRGGNHVTRQSGAGAESPVVSVPS